MTHGDKITRRAALRGLGTVVTLPWLDSLLPRSLAAGSTVRPPRRLAFVYVPNGAMMNDWTPKVEGANFELPDLLKPMEPFKQDLLVLSGLTCDKARPNGDGAGDHARAGAAFLTGSQPRKTAGANFRAGPSVDQVAAGRLGDQTRLPSLELAIERYRGVGNCD